ncbi:MAG TPA: BamA/TamA family outer membrane protein [Candidatus Manganitrophaceae bacterium]|nr:BamA/TamA family outer membrane protein [Candidatus Manganitrophaceae bacterium]
MILLLPFFLLISLSSAWGASPEYQIVAAYSEEAEQIYGSEKILFTNEGSSPLSELYLFLYPNLYLEKDPNINVLFYQRAYPVGFNPGEMQITAIHDLQGTSLPVSPDVFKSRILMRVRLPTPIPAGGSFEFIVHFKTVIPEKYGVFGYYRNLVTLEGGWHPYLASYQNGRWDLLAPPPPGRWKVRFTLPSDRELVASVPWKESEQTDSNRILYFEADGLPYFSLSFGTRLDRIEKKIGPVELTYLFRSKDRSYSEEILKVISEATDFFLKESGPLPPTRLQLAESYLYQDLVTPSIKTLFLSTKLLKAFPLLKRFHDVRIARGIFVLLWREKLPWEEGWVIDGIAGLETRRFFRDRYGPRPSIEAWLRPIAFIPIIDEILYSRDLPLRQIYFSESVSQVVNEEIPLFNNARAERTSVFYKLYHLLGEETVNLAVSTYLGEIAAGKTPSFRDTITDASKTNLDGFFKQWLSGSTALDFGIEKIEKKIVEEGYLTTLLIRKKGEGVEPIEILAQEINGTTIPMVWQGDTEYHEEVLMTPSPIGSVQLDPDHQSSDPNLFNNRYPHPWKVLVTEFPAPGYDVNTRTVDYSGEIQFQRVYDYRNRVAVHFSHSGIGDSGGVTVSHVLKNNHGLSFGLNYLGPATPIDSPPQEPAGTFHLGYTLSYPDIPFLPLQIQRLTGRYPKIDFAVGYDQRFTGGIYESLFIASADLRRSYLFSNYHEIAARFFWGESFGSLFKDSRYFLGGPYAMRGYLPRRYEGNNMVLISLEYRFPIYYETDMNLKGLALTHTLQGVLFTDTGNASDYQTLLSFTNYKFDAGAGIRWYIDSLGFYPVILRVDVAWPVASQVKEERKPHYYISAGQTF